MNADFIVIGAHGSTGITRFLLGSVARAVLRFSYARSRWFGLGCGKMAGGVASKYSWQLTIPSTH
jgi:hypothetical protein